MVRWNVAITATMLAGLAATAVSAQSWSGRAGVGIEVSDRSGSPVAGAEVALSYSETEEGGGPGVLRTGPDGRAEVRGLTEGRWLLQVSHPDYLSYVASLEVREGRRPRELSATQVKTGDSLESLRVRYFEVRGGAPSPRPEPRPAPEAQPEPAAAPPPAPAPRPAPAPEPAPKPAPAPKTQAPPEASPAPVEPTPAPAPAPQAAPAAVASPPPAPAPRPAPPPAPAPAPETWSAAVYVRSFQAGTCPECQPGEWAVSAPGVAGTTGEACPGDLADRIKAAASTLDGAGVSGLATYAGPLAEVDARGAVPPLGAAGAAMAQALAPYLVGDSACRLMAVHLPAGARFIGYQYEATGGEGWVPCLPDKECPGGRGGRWLGNPFVERGSAGTVVAGVYQNGAGGEARRVKLTVFYKSK